MLMSTKRFLLIACFAAFGLATGAMADNLAISPIGVLLDGSNPAAEVNLRNNGQSPKVIQVELLKWSQQEGKDVYTPTRELLINPPVFTLQPGKTQLIRIGLNRAPDDLQELAYRLYVQEVPPPSKPGFTGLKMALRIGVPVFVKPKGQLNPGLRWKASRTDGGAIKLAVSNEGNSHMELIDVRLTEPPEGYRVINWDHTHFYLLPGQSRELVLKPEFEWKGDRFNLTARTDKGTVEATIALEKEKP